MINQLLTLRYKEGRQTLKQPEFKDENKYF